MRHSVLAVLPFCVLLSACASTGSSGGATPSAPAAPIAEPADGGVVCDNTVLAEYVGKAPTPELLEQARARSGARHVRVGQPGMSGKEGLDLGFDRLHQQAPRTLAQNRQQRCSRRSETDPVAG